MKKLLVILVLGLLWCNVGVAETFMWSCLNNDKFQMNIEIDTSKKKIKHISSYDFATKTQHKVNKYFIIVDWDFNNGVYAAIMYSKDYSSLSFFDLKNNKIYLNGISSKYTKSPSTKLEYECHKVE